MFNQKLKKAMSELGITQMQVVGLTGKSKASISQYLSGKQVPTEKGQTEIALALGLPADYFEKDEPIQMVNAIRNGGIPTLQIADVARLMHKHKNTIAQGLQQGVFPWGYAIHTSEHRWSYFINATRFAEIEGISIPLEEAV